MVYKLTVLVPGIRTQNWEKLYRSIADSTTQPFEVIFIGPYSLPEQLRLSNVSWIKDFGSPIRCQQLGLTRAGGEYINWAADDGYFTPGSMDVGFRLLEGKNYKSVVMGKYFEGEGNEAVMENTDYYRLNYHAATRTAIIPNNFLTLNLGLISKQLLYELGGWDAQTFEVCPMAYADLAIRAQRHGAEFIIQDEIMFRCGHMPGTTGDHGPIHYAQTQHDEPVYRIIHSHPASAGRIRVPLDNWAAAPNIWTRRFDAKV